MIEELPGAELPKKPTRKVVADFSKMASPERESPFHLKPQNITPVLAVTLGIISSITFAALISVVLRPDVWYPYGLLSLNVGGAWAVVLAFFGREKKSAAKSEKKK